MLEDQSDAFGRFPTDTILKLYDAKLRFRGLDVVRVIISHDNVLAVYSRHSSPLDQSQSFFWGFLREAVDAGCRKEADGLVRHRLHTETHA